jgi:threonine dehydrogenase-like Zn-dependent dehydrogenase
VEPNHDRTTALFLALAKLDAILGFINQRKVLPNMKKAFFPALHKLPIVRDDCPVPVYEDDQVLVKVKMGSICNLTDTHTIEGLHPPHHLWVTGHFTNPPNSFPAPIGHEGAGEIVEAGSTVKNFKVGDRVSTVYTSEMFAEYAAVNQEHLGKLPDSISWEEAAPMEMLFCVYPLVEEAVRTGDVVAILGQGASGLITTQCAVISGARKIIVVEPDEFKRNLSLRLGAHIALDPGPTDIEEAIFDITEGVGVDTVIECAGMPETIKLTTRLVRRGTSSGADYKGIIGIFGACRHPVPFDFMELHWKGVKVLTTGSTRHGYTQFALERAIDLVESGLFSMKPLVTHKFPMSKVDQAFAMIMHKKDPFIKVLVDIESSKETGKQKPLQAYRLFDEVRKI